MARPALMAALSILAAAVAASSSAGGMQVKPSDYVVKIDNPWYPLRPGTTFVYRGSENGAPTRDVVRVTSRTKTILGVRCVVVSDNVYRNGLLEERTSDWYAQDRKGNVWYFGEATAEIDNGRVTGTEGSWEAGVDGARPGIVMPAQPRAGRSFRQEYYKGHAEDWFRIVSLSARVDSPFVSSRRAMLTREWTPLEPGIVDRKYYVRGVGTVKDETAKGPPERIVLVSVKRS